jgi:nucleoside-diphosphate-sugar epimerase
LLFIDDAVEGIQQITHSGYGDPINLSGDEYATVNQMVDLVQGIAGTDVGVKYKGGTTGVQSRISKNTRCRLKLGWEPSVGLKEGFEKTWRYWWDLTLRELGGTTH